MPRGFVREQFEDEPGYEGADVELSIKVLDSPATSVENSPEPAPLERDDELRGADEPLEVFPDEYDPTWSFRSRAYPDLLGFRLTHLLGAPRTVEGDGATVRDPDGNTVPRGAYMHEWAAPYGPAGDAPLTTNMLLGYADEGTYIRMTGCAAEELSLSSGEAGGVQLETSGRALHWATIVDPSITPTPEALATRPFMRRGLRVTLWQGRVLDLSEFGVTVTNPVEFDRALGVASAFPSIAEKAEGPITVMIEAPKRKLRSADLDALMDATRFAVKALWESQNEIGATRYPYRLWLEGDGAQYTGGGPEALENRRRIGASYQAKLTSDGSGASSKFTLVNATAEYFTFAGGSGSGSGSGSGA